MEVNTNFRLLLWGVSIIQPSSPDEVLGYLKAVLNDDGLLPEIEVMEVLASSPNVEPIFNCS